jgi:hypothetical protein
MEKVIQPVATTPSVVIATNGAYPNGQQTLAYPAANQAPPYPNNQNVV